MGLSEQLAARRFHRRMRREVRPERFGAWGEGTIVHPPVAVSRPAAVTIGASSFVLANATFTLGPEGSVAIGARCYLGRDLTVVALGPVVIGDDVMGSDRLLLADSGPAPTRHGVPVGAQEAQAPRAVVVEDGVFLGTGAMVMPGVRVGARSFVGAGAVVTASVPPNCVVVGNPARVVRHFDPGREAWVDGAPG